MSLLGSEDATATGVVRDVTWHEMQTPSSLSFRVEQTDETGNVTGYTQARAESIEAKNVVSEGDEVTVHGSVSGDGLLEVSEVENETTGVTFSPDGGELGTLVFLGPPAVGAMLGGLGGLIGIVPGSAAGGAMNGTLAGAGQGLAVGVACTFLVILGLAVWGAVR
ncbi:hypothetical protein [Halorubellus salinus]|uniref:hypothetical protein n=1 Tax=Halorubellus salinus TaxID=755309 RepID=UPI001D0785DC|nr:hypothetical protein [Halorubellus salinus]